MESFLGRQTNEPDPPNDEVSKLRQSPPTVRRIMGPQFETEREAELREIRTIIREELASFKLHLTPNQKKEA